MQKSNQPIGIFDSGIGGLTVAKAVKELLPEEQIIYFGDTAHLPYGDKSAASIKTYSVRIAGLLLKRKCKVILIACNSASSVAFELVTEYVGKRARVFNVIDPAIDFIQENHASSTVGLIGTRQTVLAGVYERKINALELDIKFEALATPLLVPMIEDGFYHNQISHDIIRTYLQDDAIRGVEALILGCTHYPIIKNEIATFYEEQSRKVEIIDSAKMVAGSLRAYLEHNQLRVKKGADEDVFLVSDFTKSFEHTTKIFFGEKVHLEKSNHLG